jgi:phospholipid/cholesterol/gamma-HCH transport system substrate-binding protein
MLRSVELLVGAFVGLGIAALFMLAMQVSNLSELEGDDGYELTARFQNIGGLRTRAAVTVAGVLVGRVTGIEYDMQNYEAVVTMRISPRYDRLPRDTTAAIFTAGLLGEQYVGLEPGGARQYLQDGDSIRITQSALVLEQIIGQFLFNRAAE